MGMLLLMLALNFGISWFNCYSCGKVWTEAKALGGWPRFMAWCGAIQAAIGFSSVIGFAIGAGLHATGHLPAAVAHGAVSAWYLLIIIPVLGTGLAITIESWIIAFRERSLANMGGAAYNTLAMAHNAYGAVDGIGQALKGVSSLLDTKDDEGGSNLVLMAFGLVLAALASGILLAAVLIRRYSSTSALPVLAQA